MPYAPKVRPTVVSPVWQLDQAPHDLRCAQCRRRIVQGELVAWHVLSRLFFHPDCAGVASHGAVVSPKSETAVPAADV